MKLPSDIAQQPGKNSKNKLLISLKIIGLAGGIFLISWFISKTDINNIWEQLKKINIHFLWLLLITSFAYLLASIAWQLCFLDKNDTEKISTGQLFIVRLVGESLAQINPTNVIAGETLKAYLLRRKGISLKQSVISLTVSRFLIVLASITLIFIGIFLFFNNLASLSGKGLLITAAALIIGFFIFMFYLLQSGKGILSIPIAVLKIIKKLFKSEKFAHIIKHLKEIDSEITVFYKTMKFHFLAAYFLSILHWIIGAMEFYIILTLLGVNISIINCIAVEVGVMVFKALGSFIPGQIGVEEAGNKVMLEFVTISGGGLWVTVSILRRARQMFWIGLGFIAFFFIMRQTKGAKNGSVVYNS